MGYYASTEWGITFRSEQAVQDACKELRTFSWVIAPEDGDTWLSNIGEVADETWDGTSLTGYTGGKYSWDAEGAIKIIAKHADGEVYVDASDSGDGHWKYVLEDGKATHYAGRIVYADEKPAS